LDGETNLKAKLANKDIQHIITGEQTLKNLNGDLECEAPNNLIHKFEGNIKTARGEAISLSTDNLILRGSSLRNTD
jgi:magnesium-transporting ATPase (P-type)